MILSNKFADSLELGLYYMFLLFEISRILFIISIVFLIITLYHTFRKTGKEKTHFKILIILFLSAILSGILGPVACVASIR